MTYTVKASGLKLKKEKCKMGKEKSVKVGLDVSRNQDVKSSFVIDAYGKKFPADDRTTAKIDTLLTSAITSKQNSLALSVADEIMAAFTKKLWDKTIIHLDVQEVVLDGDGKGIAWYRDFHATMTVAELSKKVEAFRLIQSTIENYKLGSSVNHRSFKPGSSKPEAKTTTTKTKTTASWLPKKSQPKPETQPEIAKVEVIQ